jgi:DNA repair photolyase
MDSLFDERPIDKRTSIGACEVTYKPASSILTEAKGFMSAYDYTLNPYSGCSFGCNYCYAASFSRTEELRQNWGYWVNVKDNALQLLRKRRSKPLSDKTVYLSSVTDPYQPIERDVELTRAILKELVDYHQPRLVIQTRSPIVTRDLDLLKQFDTVQVNMTITTDSEAVRKIFEPLCPANSVRLKAIQQVYEAGIESCITMTPLLPIVDVHEFAQSLLSTGVKKYVVQPFHPDKGKFVGSTKNDILELIREMNWTLDKYDVAVAVLRSYIPDIGIGKEGFKPI